MSDFFPPFLGDARRSSAGASPPPFRILPIPYEGTVCFGKGTALGPERICAVSDQMEFLDEETLIPFAEPGVETLPPVPPCASPAEMMRRVESAVREEGLFTKNSFPIILGGEHSITAPVVRVAKEGFPNLSVLQFDAHSDLRNRYGDGGKNSHACVMRRILELGCPIVQVGIRSFSEEDMAECPEQVAHFIPPSRVEDDFSGTLQFILDRLTDTVYITFDMDAFDPSMAPGVGTPEPGGLLWRPVVKILREIFRAKRVVGADVVETLPLGGNHVVTEFLAARLVAKMMTFHLLSAHR